MYVLAQDSTVDAPDIDYTIALTGITDATNAVLTYSTGIAANPPFNAWKVGDTFTVSGAPATKTAFNGSYTVTALSQTGLVVSVTTSKDTSAAPSDLISFDGASVTFTDDDITEDSERILPADRCIWHILPSDDASTKGGYRVSDVVFYDGNSTDPSAQTGDFRLGYLGKSGRFVPISN